jgi:hypothetical protein
MNVDFQVLESQISETEMALLMMVNVAMNAALLAGAKPQLIVEHLGQHEKNFAKINQPIAAHMTAAMALLVKNAAGHR